MGTQTSKGLLKPDPIADPQTPVPFNQNSDRINDYGMGLYICTSTTRPTGGNVWPGLQILETDTKAKGVYDGANWLMFDTIPQTYTPIIKDNAGTAFTLGNGTIIGRYMRTGLQINAQFKHVFGSTTTWAAGGLMRFGLPFISDISVPDTPVGRATILDSSAADLRTFGARLATQLGYFNLITAAPTAGETALTNTTPWTWGTSDYVAANVTYFAAAGYIATT